VGDSLEEASDRLFIFARLTPSQRHIAPRTRRVGAAAILLINPELEVMWRAV
jgi:hypothetical protein